MLDGRAWRGVWGEVEDVTDGKRVSVKKTEQVKNTHSLDRVKTGPKQKF